MNVYRFSIPDRNINIFRCDVYDENNNFRYHREIHMYDKDASEELNTLVLTKKMAATLGVDEKDLFGPIRIAIVAGKSIWQNTSY